MALVYEPGDALAFRQPFKALTQDTLRLTNKNNAPVAFKIKTTAPKQYCVRPNAGRIDPVVLQAMKEEPPADFKCRDKFLVQSIQISPEMDAMPMTELWAMVEREARSSISEKKLRVRYLPENAKQQQQQQQLQKQQREEEPRRGALGPSPLARNAVDSEDSAARSPSPESKSSPSPVVDDKKSPAMVDAPGRLFPESSSAPSPTDTTHPTESTTRGAEPEKLPANNAHSAELDKATVTIRNLERQVADLRVQLAAKPAARASLKPVQPTTDGLSIPSVAIIALVAFFLGYFFF
ncbi:phosphatidylinositol-binding protein scs2 [Coemansia sp. RSA 1358]|nr:phosphatidylinositol-binding protein scs2 [Coemansia sp. RSA 1358]